MKLTRRGLLGGTAAIGALSVVGCASGGSDREAAERAKKLIWWDQFLPTQEVEQEIFAEFSEQDGGLPVEYTVYDPTKMGQALQLAQQSDQMPDIFTLAGAGAPVSALLDQGWFAPVTLDDAVRSDLPEGYLLPGISVFDDQVYGVHAAGFRKNDSLVWFNVDHFDKAGLDPSDPPASYDEFRTAAHKIKQATGKAGWVAPLQMAGRIANEVHQLAEAAGSPTVEGIDIRTGEYAVDSDYYLDVVEWWQSLQRDKLMFAASNSLVARTARARWAAGEVGLFLDGQYCIGVVAQEFDAFVDKVGVGPVPVPDGPAPVAINHSPRSPGNTLFLSADCANPDAASKLLSTFAGQEAQKRMVSGMSFPPLYPDVVSDADAHPTFKQALAYFAESDYLAPDPVVRNPAIAAVLGEMTEVQPGLGEIVAGVLTGDVPDAKKALSELKANLTKAREQAVQKVASAGEAVSVDDWAFPNWEPGTDYGLDAYPS